MAAAVYILGFLTSLLCSILLLRGYWNTRKRLLLWCGLCFAGLTISNLFVFIDLAVIREIDFYRFRLGSAAIAMLVMLYGLIWETEA